VSATGAAMGSRWLKLLSVSQGLTLVGSDDGGENLAALYLEQQYDRRWWACFLATAMPMSSPLPLLGPLSVEGSTGN